MGCTVAAVLGVDHAVRVLGRNDLTGGQCERVREVVPATGGARQDMTTGEAVALAVIAALLVNATLSYPP